MFKGHPKGLIAAALANMGERFGYYIFILLCGYLFVGFGGRCYRRPYPELQRNDSNRIDNHGNGLCAVVYSDFSNEYEYSLVTSAYLFCIVYDSFWQWFV